MLFAIFVNHMMQGTGLMVILVISILFGIISPGETQLKLPLYTEMDYYSAPLRLFQQSVVICVTPVTTE